MKKELRIQVLPHDYYNRPEAVLPDAFTIDVDETKTLSRIQFEAFHSHVDLFEQYALGAGYEPDSRYDPKGWVLCLRNRELREWEIIINDCLDIVREDGAVYFAQDLSYVTLADLRRAVAEGIVPYDADPLGFIAAEGLGADGEVVQSVLDAWPLFSTFLVTVAAIVVGEGIISVSRHICKHLGHWRRKKAEPRRLFDFTRSRDVWSVAKLAELLGLSEGQVSSVLAELGYSCTTEGTEVLANASEELTAFEQLVQRVEDTEWWLVLPIEAVHEISILYNITLPYDWLEQRRTWEEYDDHAQ